MKPFLIGALGALGALTVLIVTAIALPHYSEYSARAEALSWYGLLGPTRVAIGEKALRLNSTHGAGVGVVTPTPEGASSITITTDGLIFVVGAREGQLMVLVPALAGGKVTWQCLGGSRKAMPAPCRG